MYVGVLFGPCSILFLLFRYFPLKIDVFPSSICEPDLFQLNRLFTIEQWYTTIAFI